MKCTVSKDQFYLSREAVDLLKEGKTKIMATTFEYDKIRGRREKDAPLCFTFGVFLLTQNKLKNFLTPGEPTMKDEPMSEALNNVRMKIQMFDSRYIIQSLKKLYTSLRKERDRMELGKNYVSDEDLRLLCLIRPTSIKKGNSIY